jgi:hypothetical protein
MTSSLKAHVNWAGGTTPAIAARCTDLIAIVAYYANYEAGAIVSDSKGISGHNPS